MDVTIALIQPIHGQGYNSDIPRPDAPVIYMGAFPILTAQPGRRSIYNTPVRMDQGVMAMKEFSTIRKTLGLDPRHQMHI